MFASLRHHADLEPVAETTGLSRVIIMHALSWIEKHFLSGLGESRKDVARTCEKKIGDWEGESNETKAALDNM
jgi:hypothetical protein